MTNRTFSTTFSNPSNKPSSMEGAFASLGFDPPAGPSISLCHTHAQQILDTARSASSPRMQPITRHHSANNNAAVNLDPVPGDPGCVFIKPPFTDYPGSEKQKTGLTYNILAAHPEWFLDVNDFIGPNAAAYPPQLEPPRGWCPTKKKEARDGWKEGEEPRLRCTLCRRQYAGVNAKSMWRRHVYEKHKIAMANRRENNDRPSGRGARSSNMICRGEQGSTPASREGSSGTRCAQDDSSRRIPRSRLLELAREPCWPICFLPEHLRRQQS
ncbi:hypothetical protein LXA43DRAFT_179711 [Ganoderma leucocontextum]|nr:hypothetical protein LXA43DRAFT_179711 [Ganoderma leucocontextum]